MSQSHFVKNIQGHAGRSWYHLDWTPGLNTYRKNPFSVATLSGEKVILNLVYVRIDWFLFCFIPMLHNLQFLRKQKQEDAIIEQDKNLVE